MSMSLPSKKILFIYPECKTKTFGSNEGKGSHKEKTISPPLGILYLSTELIKAGYSVDACDFNAEYYSDDNLFHYLKQVDLVGISLLSFNRSHATEIIQKIKQYKPQLPIIVGGPDCILHPRMIEGATATVCQEAETIIVPLVEAIFQGKDLGTIPGIFYKNSENILQSATRYTLVEDLDTIQFPHREVLGSNKGYSILGNKTSQLVTSIITSRGCPKHCTFCAHGAVAYQKYRARSAENVLFEIELIAQQGYKIVGIVDDNFTADKRRATHILNGIIEMNTSLSFAVQGRVDAADFSLFQLMKKARVTLITFGLESGNQDILNFYNKETTVEQNRNAVVWADRAGLYTAGLFILGAPQETKEHFKNTYRFTTQIPLDITSFWVLDYTYGSKLWNDAHKQGKIQAHEFNVPAGKERGTSPFSTAELEKISRSYFFRFYCRPVYWIRQVKKFFRTKDWYFLQVLSLGIQWLIVKRCTLILHKLRIGC